MTMKIRVKEYIIDVPDYFKVVGNKLYNNNTKKYEGVDGDIVTVKQGDMVQRGHIKGYTEYQIVPTYEWPTMVVSAQGIHDGSCRIDYIHQTPVYEIES